jgi:hypothetical protein
MQNTIPTPFIPKSIQRLGGVALLLAMAGTAQAQTNNALAFDGNDDYVELGVGSAGRPSGNADFTYESWYYNSGGQTGDRWMAWFGTPSANAAAIIGYDGATSKVKFNHYASGNDLTSNVVLPVGRWSHLAVVWRGAAMQADIYLNGVLSQTLQYTAQLAIPTSSSFQLGTFLSNSSYCVNGRLDEVRLYTSALTAANIQADMFRTAASVPASQLIYFDFDQGTANGTNTGQSSLTNRANSTSNSGTLTNFALGGNNSNWVRSFPTITGISPASGPRGATVSISGTNLSDASSFVFNDVSVSSFTISNDLTATATVPASASTGPVGLASATLTRYNGPSFSLITDLVVNSPTSIAAGNYNSITINSGGVATLAGNVSVSGSITINSGGTLNDGCAIISGAGSFTLAAGGTLGICNAAGIASNGASGAVQTTGTRSFSPDASYLYNGTTAQSTGSGLPSQVRSLSTTNANNVTLSAPIRVAQVVTIGGAGNLVLNGNALTLLSSAAGTALVVNSGTGLVSGNTATVQRYIDASGNTGTSGYRHYSAPVSGATVASLATASFTPVVNAAYNSAANSVAVTPYPTVYGYDQSRVGSTSVGTNLSAFDQGYVSPGALTDPLTVGQGYTVQLGNAELVSLTGTLNSGNQTITGSRSAQAGAGWQLIGNPYPAPLDWGTVASSQLTNMDAAAYVFQSTSAYGGRYTSFTNGIGANAGLIATGQGFFVRANAATGSVALTNANRATTYGATPKFQRTAADARPQLHLSLTLDSAPATVQDETFVYFEQGATAGFDGQYDAYKLANPSGYYLGTAAQVPAGTPETGLSISGRAPLTTGTTDAVPVWLSVPAGTYSLTANDLTSFTTLAGGTSVYLRDALTGTLTNLATTPSYSFSVAANAPSTGRFTLLFGTATPLATTNAALSQTIATLYPNPSTTGEVTLSATGLPTNVRSLHATLLDMLGRPVATYHLPAAQGAASTSLPTRSLPSGIYLLRLTPYDAQGAAVGTLPTQRLSVR